MIKTVRASEVEAKCAAVRSQMNTPEIYPGLEAFRRDQRKLLLVKEVRMHVPYSSWSVFEADADVRVRRIESTYGHHAFEPPIGLPDTFAAEGFLDLETWSKIVNNLKNTALAQVTALGLDSAHYWIEFKPESECVSAAWTGHALPEQSEWADRLVQVLDSVLPRSTCRSRTDPEY